MMSMPIEWSTNHKIVFDSIFSKTKYKSIFRVSLLFEYSLHLGLWAEFYYVYIFVSLLQIEGFPAVIIHICAEDT